MRRVALLTHYTVDKADYSRVAAFTVPNRDEYATRHGYTHLVRQGHYHDSSLYYAIDRLHFLHSVLWPADEDPENPPPEIVWVLNVQAVITNLAKPITDYLTNEPHGFWATGDCHVPINAGSFIVRRSEWTKRWVEMLMRESPHVGHCWHENQQMLISYQLPEWRDGICLLPQNTINSYRYDLYNRPTTTPGHWTPDDLVLSLPGTNLEQRLSIVSEMLRKQV